MGVTSPNEEVQIGAHRNSAARSRGAWSVLLYCDTRYVLVLRVGKVSSPEGLANDFVQIRLHAKRVIRALHERAQ